jgi:hypothetical protein
MRRNNMKRIASDDNRLSKPLIDAEEARRELMKLVIIDDEEPAQETVCVKEATSMKRIVITVLGTKDKPHGKPHIDFLLHPGVTAGQILNRTPQHWYTQAASGIAFFCNCLTAAVTAFV